MSLDFFSWKSEALINVWNRYGNCTWGSSYMSEKASIKKSTLEIESGGEKMKKGSGVKQKK